MAWHLEVLRGNRKTTREAGKLALTLTPTLALTLLSGRWKKVEPVEVSERETGFEPATACLGSKNSTTELLPQRGGMTNPGCPGRQARAPFWRSPRRASRNLAGVDQR